MNSSKIIQRLQEAKSISDQVFFMSKEIVARLDSLFRNAPKTNLPFSGTTLREGNFVYENNGISFTVIWRFYNFKNENYYIEGVRKAAKSDLRNKDLYVDFYSIGWKIDQSKLLDLIQHEICHFFEYNKQPNIDYTVPERYRYAVRVLKNSSKNEPDYSIARIIYISHRFEQRAFVNGAYGYLMSSNDYNNSFKNAIKETVLYKWLINIYKSVSILKKSPISDVETALKPYHYSPSTIIKIAERTKENLIWLIGRVLSKAMEDYPEKNIVMESFDGGEIDKNKNKWLQQIMRRYFCRI